MIDTVTLWKKRLIFWISHSQCFDEDLERDITDFVDTLCNDAKCFETRAVNLLSNYLKKRNCIFTLQCVFVIESAFMLIGWLYP